MMDNCSYLILVLNEQRFGLPITSIDRVVRAAEVTPVPEAPDFLAGVINIGGTIVPVVNYRKNFRLPDKSIDINDKFIITKAKSLTLAIVADAVGEIVTVSESEMTEMESLFPGIGLLRGVVQDEGDIMLIQDLDLLINHDVEHVVADIVARCNENGQ